MMDQNEAVDQPAVIDGDGSVTGKKKAAPAMLKGDSPLIQKQNVRDLMSKGMDELTATKHSMAAAGKAPKKAGHPNRAKNLGQYHHPKKA